MKHLLLTISVYPPEADEDTNRRRLALTSATSVPSVALGTVRPDEWVIALHPDDPLHDERAVTYQASGVPCTFVHYSSTLPADPLHAETVPVARRRRVLSTSPLVEPWLEVYARGGALFADSIPDGDVLVSRLDDDDAYSLRSWTHGR